MCIRDSYNPVKENLQFESSGDENSGDDWDFLSNGIKIRTAWDAVNGGPDAHDTIVYGAFAESPFGGDGVAQARAR